MFNIFKYKRIKIRNKNYNEITELIERSETYKIERIRSKGLITPKGTWYNQQQDEWVVILKGKAILNIECERTVLKKGDSVLLPKNTKHRVEYTSKNCVWLCFYSN